MNRNSFAAIAATLAVLVVVGLGFHFLGGPASQRSVRGDEAKVRAMAQLARGINQAWHASDKALPPTLDKLPAADKKDPASGVPFLYQPKSGSEYELCATFATDNRDNDNPNLPDFWIHPKGDYCFQIDAAKPVPNAPYYYYR
jgi:hypothetical protein